MTYHSKSLLRIPILQSEIILTQKSLILFPSLQSVIIIISRNFTNSLFLTDYQGIQAMQLLYQGIKIYRSSLISVILSSSRQSITWFTHHIFYSLHCSFIVLFTHHIIFITIFPSFYLFMYNNIHIRQGYFNIYNRSSKHCSLSSRGEKFYSSRKSFVRKVFSYQEDRGYLWT